MKNVKALSKIENLKKVLSFSSFMFSFLIIVAYIVTLHRRDTTIQTGLITQVLIYIGMMAFGIATCLTDLIFTKASVTKRIIAFGTSLYIITVAYFSFTGTRLARTPAMLVGYTFIFVCTITVICILWYAYETSLSMRYSTAIAAYHANHKNS